MPFQIKNFISIVAGAINTMRATTSKITDYNVGGVARTLVEAPSAEIEELYIQMTNGLVEAIPTATYQSFGFDRQAAFAARGEVVFTLGAPVGYVVNIPINSQLFTEDDVRKYITLAAGVIEIGETEITIPIQAIDEGIIGNTLPGSISKFPAAPTDMTVTNLIALTSGLDIESNSDQKARFAAYIQSLSRGTLSAIRYAAGLAKIYDVSGNVTEQIRRVGVIEEIPGKVSVYVFNGQSSTSDEIVAESQKIIDGYEESGAKVEGYRAAGVQVVVAAMGEAAQDLTATVTPLPGYSLDAAMVNLITNTYTSFLSTLAPGEPMYFSVLTGRLLGVTGVLNIDISTPSDNVLSLANTVIIPGTISIS